MQIGIVGLGLIGGSLAKAAKERTDYTVLGFDRNDGRSAAGPAAGCHRRRIRA